MAFARRTSPGRRVLIAEGRARVLGLAAGAALLGGAVPVALAADADHPACVDPARTTPTVTLPDGQVLDCVLETPPAEKETPKDGDAVPDAPPPGAGKPEEPPAPPAEPAAPAADAPGPPPSDAAPAAPPVEAPAAPTAAPTVAAKVAAAPGGPTADKPRREPSATRRRGADEGAGDRVKGRTPDGAKGRDADDRREKRRHRPKAEEPDRPPHAKRDEPAGATRPEKDPHHEAAHPEPAPVASYDALPAAWTSLAPLELPAADVDGFPIPPYLLPIYQAAAAQYGVPWEILASINEIETDFGRNAGISSAGAMGWMQFIPSSWKRWGTDSDADHRRDPRNPVDAIFAAGRYLRDAGAADDLPQAIFAYNHAGWYVERVVRRAREFAALDPMVVAALTRRALREDLRIYRARGNPFAGTGSVAPSPGQALLLSKKHLTRMVLRSRAIDVYTGGREDIAAGRVDRRVLATLVFLARSGLKPTVSSITTGHGLRTASGNISAHSYGHAVDISAVNGIPIAGHQGPGSITAKALDRLVELQGYLQPNQIISLMTVEGRANTVSMGDHDDHIHLGFPRVAAVPEGLDAD